MLYTYIYIYIYIYVHICLLLRVTSDACVAAAGVEADRVVHACRPGSRRPEALECTG